MSRQLHSCVRISADAMNRNGIVGLWVVMVFAEDERWESDENDGSDFGWGKVEKGCGVWGGSALNMG